MSVEMKRLISRLDRMQRDINARPIMSVGGSAGAAILLARIIGGNTLSSGADGVKSVSGTLNVGTWYDPYTATTTPDGIGIAYLWRNGIQQFISDGAGGWDPAKVLISLDSRSIITKALAENEWCRLGAQVVVGNATPPAEASPRDLYAYTCQYY
jgi:hypothetical protein